MLNAVYNAAMPLSGPVSGLPSAEPSSDVTPAVAPSGPIGPLQSSFREQVSSIVGPQHIALMNALAGGSDKMRARESLIGKAYKGFTFGDVVKQEDEKHLASVGTALAEKAEGMDDGEFERLYASLQEQLSHPPEAFREPQMKGPSTAQLALGGLAAILAPEFAPAALAAPFAAQQQQHVNDSRLAEHNAADAYRRWQTGIQGTQGLMDDVARRDALHENIAARKDLAKQNEQARKDLEAQKIAAAKDLEHLKQQGRVALKTMSGEQRQYVANLAHQDRELSVAARMVRDAAPGEAREKLAEAFRRSHTGIFSTLDDDAIAMIGETTPAEFLKQSQTKLNDTKRSDIVLTRAGRLRKLAGEGNLLEARKLATDALKELTQERTEWLPKEAQARITHLEAVAEKARKAANDGFAGLGGAGRATLTNLERQKVKNADARIKTEASLAGIEIQRTTLRGRIAGLGQGPMQDGLRAKYEDQLDKLDAISTEKTLYLKRLDEMQQSVDQQIAAVQQQAPAQATATGGQKLFGQTPRNAAEAAEFQRAMEGVAAAGGNATAIAKVQAAFMASLKKMRGQ